MATKWGICSAGKISHDFVVALKTLPAEDHQVVAVAARNLQHAQDFAKEFGIPRAYGNYEELAKDPEIDVVYIGSIHPCHLQLGELFMNSRKNVLCEKPLAMNSREVELLVTAARKNQVFLMEISRLLAQGVVGEVKMVKADFGFPLRHVPRAVEKELGGGALLDIGIYGLQFACMVYQGEKPESIRATGVCLDTGIRDLSGQSRMGVYQGEKPESIRATGVCLDTGVDEAMVLVLTFSGNRMAVIICSVAVELPNDATIIGTKGVIKIPSHMWSPTSLIVNGKETQYPLPEPSAPLNFINSTGMRYEAEEVRQCLLRGVKESSRMSLADSYLLADIMDEARRQVGVVYDQDTH